MRIIAAEIPKHSDHLVVGLVVAALVALGAGAAIATLPAPADDVRWLERARVIHAAFLEESERRRALPPLDVDALGDLPLAASHHARPQPSSATMRAWLEERVRPVLRSCLPPNSATVHGGVTLSFDGHGRVVAASVADTGAVFRACAEPRLAELAHVEAFELSVSWRFALEP